MSVQAMKRGAVDFLPKPFRDQDMLDAVLGLSSAIASGASPTARFRGFKSTSIRCPPANSR